MFFPHEVCVELVEGTGQAEITGLINVPHTEMLTELCGNMRLMKGVQMNKVKLLVSFLYDDCSFFFIMALHTRAHTHTRRLLHKEDISDL